MYTGLRIAGSLDVQRLRNAVALVVEVRDLVSSFCFSSDIVSLAARGPPHHFSFA